ncbi:hypothetical protein N7456_004859 [Penicillium angulare]|uniref:Ricin B lectin domain-containing protein n=1 Tax=Penicillium angulare TaxID=116970 RepID=A0A9W9FXF1_9EURO|nr:hypothetical protein N7456_004859 [Penicillium angulare]
MHFSIPISGLFALLAGQACSQSASGHYVIQDNTGALTAQGDIAVFADVNGSLDQVWDFAPVGPESVVLQNQAEGNYLTCDKSGSPCSVSADPQVFVPNSQGGDFYEIKDEAKEFLLVEDEDRTVVLAKSAGPGQRSLFKLVRTEFVSS